MSRAWVQYLGEVRSLAERDSKSGSPSGLMWPIWSSKGWETGCNRSGWMSKMLMRLPAG